MLVFLASTAFITAVIAYRRLKSSIRDCFKFRQPRQQPRKLRAYVVARSRSHLPRALAIGAAISKGYSNSTGESTEAKHPVIVSVPPLSESSAACRVVVSSPSDMSPYIRFTASGTARPRIGKLMKAMRSEWKKGNYEGEREITNVTSIFRDTIASTDGDVNEHAPCDMMMTGDMPRILADFSSLCSFHPERPAFDAAAEWACEHAAEDVVNAMVGPGHGACQRWIRDIEDNEGGIVLERKDDSEECLNQYIQDVEDTHMKSTDASAILVRVGDAFPAWHTLVHSHQTFLAIGHVEFVENSERVDAMWVRSETSPAVKGVKFFHHMPSGQILTGAAFRVEDDVTDECLLRCAKRLCENIGVDDTGARLIKVPSPFNN